MVRVVALHESLWLFILNKSSLLTIHSILAVCSYFQLLNVTSVCGYFQSSYGSLKSCTYPAIEIHLCCLFVVVGGLLTCGFTEVYNCRLTFNSAL